MDDPRHFTRHISDSLHSENYKGVAMRHKHRVCALHYCCIMMACAWHKCHTVSDHWHDHMVIIILLTSGYATSTANTLTTVKDMAWNLVSQRLTPEQATQPLPVVKSDLMASSPGHHESWSIPEGPSRYRIIHWQYFRTSCLAMYRYH